MDESVVLAVHDFGLQFNGMQEFLLQHTNLIVRAGEVVLVQGRNGSGKSTLLKSILQLHPKGSIHQFEGTIEIQESVTIGYVHQRPSSQLLFFKVDEEIVAPLSFKRVSRAQRLATADKLLQKFHIETWKNADPHTLSSGQQQIVSILTNLSDNRKLLLLDEPFALLDDANRELVINALLQLKQNGYAVLLISHQFHMYNGLVDRIYAIENHTLSEQEHLSDYPLSVCKCKQSSTMYPVINCTIGYNMPLQNLQNLLLPKSGVVLLQGSNGTGKTTLLLTLDGLLSPVKGKINQISQQSSIFVPQDTISFFWKASVIKEWESYVDLSIPESLQELQHKSPFILSEGQRKWLAVQIALAAKREIILLDEPTYSLDLPTIHVLINTLRGVQDKLVIIATHDRLLLDNLKCPIIRLKEDSV